MKIPTQSKFDRFEQKLDKLTETVIEGFATCASCQRSIVSLQHDFYGRSGNGNNPGLKTRVDRLEESRKRVLWTITWISALCAAVATVAGVVFSWFSRGE